MNMEGSPGHSAHYADSPLRLLTTYPRTILANSLNRAQYYQPFDYVIYLELEIATSSRFPDVK